MRGDEARNFIGFDATRRTREWPRLLLHLAQINRLLRKGIQAEGSSERALNDCGLFGAMLSGTRLCRELVKNFCIIR